MSTYLPDQIWCTSLAGTGRDDIERLRSPLPDPLGNNQSGIATCPTCGWNAKGRDDVGTPGVTEDPTPVAEESDSWIEARDAGGGRDPRGVQSMGGEEDTGLATYPQTVHGTQPLVQRGQ